VTTAKDTAAALDKRYGSATCWRAASKAFTPALTILGGHNRVISLQIPHCRADLASNLQFGSATTATRSYAESEAAG
jgi:hypothetical protein